MNANRYKRRIGRNQRELVSMEGENFKMSISFAVVVDHAIIDDFYL